MKNELNNLTAAEEVLLAAVSLTKKKKNEFTEWDLTVETWQLNKNRWGLRGYEEKYPDHKRVMNEVMAGGTQKVVGKGWIEKIKPNYYKITSAGLAKASSLDSNLVRSQNRSLYEYDNLSPFIHNPIFENYCKNNSEPKTWLGAAAFLNLKGNNPDELDRKMNLIKEAISSALNWLEKNNKDVLSRSDSASSKPISKEKIKKLNEFIHELEIRFKTQFEAIRNKKK